MRVFIGLLVLLGLAFTIAAQTPQIAQPTITPPPPLPSSLSTLATPTPPPEALPESLQSFDPQQLRVSWNNRRWQLMHATKVLKDFGGHEQDARTAFRLILELRLNQVGTIGTQRPVLEYWLSNGEAPQTMPAGGLRLIAFDLDRLLVEQNQGQWCIREGPRTLFSFGTSQRDAQLALAVFRKYRFHQVGLIGTITPAMCIFLGHAQGSAPMLGSGNNHRAMADPRFSRQVKNSDGTPKMQFSKANNPVAEKGLDGLDRLAQPIVPSLGTPSGNVSGQPQPFQWRSRPSMGETAQINGDRIPFDWRQVNLRQDGTDWKLTAGGLLLGNFGNNLTQARLALSALRHYRFTEQHRIGGEQPYFTYFTSPTTSPRSLLLGVYADEFKPEKVEMKQQESGIVLCEGERVLVRLQNDEEAARKLLETIKRHRYDRLCRLGEVGRAEMNFLVRTR